MPSSQRDLDLMTAYADGLLAAGNRLAEKLRDIDASPWTEQILEEWDEAKDLRDAL